MRRLIDWIRGTPDETSPTLLQVDDLEVRLTRKRVKNVTLRIVPPDGRLRVTAPRRTPLAFIRAFVIERRAWIERHRARLAALPDPAALPPLTRADREALAAAIVPLAARWESALGVRASTWTIRRMKTRWGTCNTRIGRITLNLELARHPPQCLDYVVLHELAHLVEPGHGARFKALMTQHMPDWTARRARLRERPA